MHEQWVLVYANKPKASVIIQVLGPCRTVPRKRPNLRLALKILKFLYRFL
jgi:hypothetical protein